MIHQPVVRAVRPFATDIGDELAHFEPHRANERFKAGPHDCARFGGHCCPRDEG